MYEFLLVQVLQGITDLELYILDEFEDVEYERVTVDVSLMASEFGSTIFDVFLSRIKMRCSCFIDCMPLLLLAANSFSAG